jgi:MoaA/NifB/PqqE/SkfB family radical SAM enzyme
MIDQRLFDHYGIDTHKDLKIGKRCPRPYDTVLIDKRGSCYACECTSWLPQSLGNLQVKSLDEIINKSPVRGHLQNSIEDGSYRYCNNRQCSWLLAGEYDFFEEGVPEDRIKNLRLAIDDSCNLRCPSCRKDMIFHKEGSGYRLGIRLADRINEWLYGYQTPLQVHIGSDGDPFASHVYRHFMEHTPRKENIKYSILTNGLMFKEFYHKVPHVIGNLDELGVSIDGASRNTYEKLRLGGKWDKIQEGLQCISELRQESNFKFTLHFVVQKDNYHEMNDMIDMAKKFRADRVWLNKIQDWSVMGDFASQHIWDSKDYKGELAKVLKRIRAEDDGSVEDRFIECPTLISEDQRYGN